MGCRLNDNPIFFVFDPNSDKNISYFQVLIHVTNSRLTVGQIVKFVAVLSDII